MSYLSVVFVMHFRTLATFMTCQLPLMCPGSAAERGQWQSNGRPIDGAVILVALTGARKTGTPRSLRGHPQGWIRSLRGITVSSRFAESRFAESHFAESNVAESRCQRNARKNITVTVSVRVSVMVRVSLVWRHRHFLFRKISKWHGFSHRGMFPVPVKMAVFFCFE